MLAGMTTELVTQAEAARRAVLAKVDRFQATTRLADSGISRAAVTESGFVHRLRRGENVTLEKLSRLEVWLDEALAKASRAGPSSSSRLPAVASSVC